MTLQKSSHNRTHNASLSYFAFLLRQNWPAFVTNLIILLLVNVVVLSMALSSDGSFYREQTYNVILANAIGYAEGYRVANIIIGALLAVLWGSGTMTYVNSKVSVHFYHSIPLTRGTMYLSEILVKVICYAVPAFVTSALSICVIGVNTGIWHAMVTGILLSGGLYAILYFVFYLSIMVFAASFTGNAFSRLMTAGLVVFMPSALILFVTTILQFNSIYTSYDSLYNLALEFFTPVRIVASFVNADLIVEETSTYISRGWETVGTILAALLFFLAGYLIYRKRRSEQSGLPVLSKIASALIKYTCMFCAAAAFGYIFELFGDGAISYCIGSVIGALLAMMLINVILTKSAKQLFARLPGLGIFCTAFIVGFVLFGVDVVGLDRHIPQASMIRELTMNIDGEVEFVVENEEDEKFYTDMIREYLNGNNDSGYPRFSVSASEITVAEKAYPYPGSMSEEETEAYLRDVKQELLFSERSMYIHLVYKPYFGLPVHKNIDINRDGFEEFLERVVSSENFAELYFPDVTKDDAYYENARLEIQNNNTVEIGEAEAWRILNSIRNSFNGKEYFQRSTAVSFYLRASYNEPIKNGRSTQYTTVVRLPYYGADKKYTDLSVQRLSAVYVLDRETMELKRYSSKAEIEAIYNSVCLVNSSRYNSIFTDTDSRYAAALVSVDEENYKYGISSFTVAHFLSGQVPDFVK